MKLFVNSLTAAIILLSSITASAVQCNGFLDANKKTIKSSDEKTYDKVLKNYLMVNLTYPQSDVGLSYVLVGLVLSGKASHQEITNSIYKAPKEKLEILYTSMKKTHAAHGVQTDVPFSKIVKMTRNIEEKVDFVLMSTFSVLFPDYTPKIQGPASVINEFTSILDSEDSPKNLRIRAYGELMLSSLRDKEAMAYAKMYRQNFRKNVATQADNVITTDQISDFLQAHMKLKFEEAFPETKQSVGPMFDGSYKPLSEALGSLP